MQDWFEDVRTFHRAFRCSEEPFPRIPDPAVVELRDRLIKEEFSELLQATSKENLSDIADAIVDLIYVLLGMAIAYGIDIRPVWDEVQKANLAKIGGGFRADGKIMKPKDWCPPDVAGIIQQQISEKKRHGG